MGYRASTIAGISWLTIFRITSRGITFAKLAIIARLLTPSQFGVFGVASIVLSLLEVLTETGINTVLIQSKKNLSEYINSAWVISIARGFFISIFIIISSPFISSFFNSPDSLGVLLFISLVPFVRGFINPASVKFQKELAFKYEFWFRISIFSIDAGITTILVLLTQSVYGLVVGALAGALAEVFLSFILISPKPKFKIRTNLVKEIFKKGKWMTAYTVFNYLGQEGDDIVVGRVMGAQALGFYQMAFKISILPISEVSEVVSKVVFPVYSKISHEKDRLFKAFIKTVIFTAVSSVAIGAILFLFPQELVLLAFGEKWLPVVPVLKVLIIYGVLRTISGPTSALFLSLNKQNYIAVMTFFRLVVLLITIYPLVLSFGLIGAGISAVLSVILEIPVMIYYLIRVYKSVK